MRRALVLLLMLPLLAAAAPPTVFVSVYPRVRIEADAQGRVELGKLARVIAPQREQRRSLQALQVPVGQLRHRESVSGPRLRALLADLPELAGAEIVVPDTVAISAARDSGRTQEAMAAAALELRKYAEATWPGRYRNLEFSLLVGERALALGPETAYHFDFSALQGLGRRTPVWLVMESRGREERAALWFEVRGETLVWQALADMQVRDAAAGAAFAERWRDIGEADRGEPAAPAADQRLVAAMQAGDILTADHLELAPAIDYGEDTRVVSRVGDVQIMTVATALETAFVGDLVYLRSKSSDERFQARVVDRNLAAIERGSQWADASASGGE